MSPLMVLGMLVVIGFVLSLPEVKGMIGEGIMWLCFTLFLPAGRYRVIHNVTIPDGRGGTTQIDHVVVSAHGVFFIETKHYKGWIFGGEYDRQWTQKIHARHSQRFQNPLRQNYNHTECLRDLLGLEKEHVFSVAVFTGSCTLKTRDKLPDHVTYPGSCVRYIKSNRDVFFSEDAVVKIATAIEGNRLAPTWHTAREHVAYVKDSHSSSSHATPSAPSTHALPPSCPACGASMVSRTARRGANAGSQFWGCSQYPGCRGTRQQDC